MEDRFYSKNRQYAETFIGVEFFKQVKISDKKEQRFGDIVTPFSSSNAKKRTVTISPKRCSFLSLIFTCLCFTKPLLLKNSLKCL